MPVCHLYFMKQKNWLPINVTNPCVKKWKYKLVVTQIRQYTLLSPLIRNFKHLWNYFTIMACRQYHQRFTRAFFVQNFGAKNHKAECNQKKAAIGICKKLSVNFATALTALPPRVTCNERSVNLVLYPKRPVKRGL